MQAKDLSYILEQLLLESKLNYAQIRKQYRAMPKHCGSDNILPKNATLTEKDNGKKNQSQCHPSDCHTEPYRKFKVS